ncbi:MAG: hypothetical protein Q9196_007038, partial [Gyalolechia fulgens]
MSDVPFRPHLEIFNTTFSRPSDEGSTFSLFSLLPKELRLSIWRRALQCHRIITMELKGLRGWTGTGPLYDDNDQSAVAASIDRGERYRIISDGCQVLSKLLRVSKESRQEALTFYRVHLPCRFRSPVMGEKAMTSGTLYVNPEYDFLRISPEMPVKDTLVNFLYHFKTTYDIRGVGILNLALGFNDLNGNDLYALEPSDLEPKFRNAFLDTFTQLREVFFLSTPRAGRQVNGLLSGLCTSETWFNRSFPIMTGTPTFRRRHRDPRPINQDLRKVLLSGGSDPREMLDLWFGYLRKWGVTPPRLQYRFLLGFDPTVSGGLSSDRTSAKKYLQSEDDRWNGYGPGEDRREEIGAQWPVGAKHKDWKDEDLDKA